MEKFKGMRIAIAIMVCMLMLLSISACQSSATKPTEATTTPAGTSSAQTIKTTEKPLEPYTITMLTNLTGESNSVSSDTTAVGKILKDKFNITVVFEPYAGDMQEKINLMLAARDYPEVVGLDTPSTSKYIKAGALVQLDDYVKNMPNFQQRFGDIIPYWRMADDQGRLFKWESDAKQKTAMVSVQWDLMVRTDALEAMGWPKLVTEDDYISFLQGAMKKIPISNGKKTIGLTGCFGEPWGTQAIGSEMFDKAGYVAVNNNGICFNPVKMQFEDWLSNPYCKGALQMFYKMNKAGVLDKEIFTDKYAQTDLKANNGQAICVWYTGWMAATANANLTKAGHPEMSYVCAPINLKAQVDNKDSRYMPVAPTYSSETYAITDKCKNPERIMQVLEYGASEEGQVLLGWGIEGQHYTVGADGKRVITDEFKKGYMSDANYLSKQGIRILRMFGLTMDLDKNGQDYEVFADPGVAELTYNDRQKEAFAKLGWKNNPDAWTKTGIPLVAFDKGPIGDVIVPADSEEGKIEAQVTDLRVKAVPKLILAKSDAEFESIWTKLMGDYNKIGWQKMVDKYNAVYKDAISKVDAMKNK